MQVPKYMNDILSFSRLMAVTRLRKRWISKDDGSVGSILSKLSPKTWLGFLRKGWTEVGIPTLKNGYALHFKCISPFCFDSIWPNKCNFQSCPLSPITKDYKEVVTRFTFQTKLFLFLPIYKQKCLSNITIMKCFLCLFCHESFISKSTKYQQSLNSVN